MKFSTTVVKSLVCAGMLLAGSMASAGLIVTPGNHNLDTDNVIANACEGNITAGTMVQGCLNTNHTFYINFTSDEALAISGGGQASVVAADGAFSDMTISLDAAGWTFNKLVLNIDVAAAGFVTFTGLPGGTSDAYALGNGSNFFTITGEDFTSVSFATTVATLSLDLVSDLKQTRIGGIDDGIIDNPASVPEPSILMLMGLGLLGLGMGRKFKSAKAA